jgi:hypothetical protein
MKLKAGRIILSGRCYAMILAAAETAPKREISRGNENDRY